MNKDIEIYKTVVIPGLFNDSDIFYVNINVDFPVDEIVIKQCSVSFETIVNNASQNESLFLFRSDIFDNNIFHHTNLILGAQNDSGWDISQCGAPLPISNMDIKFRFNSPKIINGSYSFFINTMDLNGNPKKIFLENDIRIPFCFTFEFRKYKK